MCKGFLHIDIFPDMDANAEAAQVQNSSNRYWRRGSFYGIVPLIEQFRDIVKKIKESLWLFFGLSPTVSMFQWRCKVWYRTDVVNAVRDRHGTRGHFSDDRRR
jgi:hypothetical protein